MSLSDKYTIRLLEDNIYQLVDKADGTVVKQGTLMEINAYLELTQKGLEL